jgi:hypothetical protein
MGKNLESHQHHSVTQKEQSMRGAAFEQWPGESRKTESVETVLRRSKEKAELRRARIMNGAEPSMINDPEVLTADARRVLGVK